MRLDEIHQEAIMNGEEKSSKIEPWGLQHLETGNEEKGAEESEKEQSVRKE